MYPRRTLGWGNRFGQWVGVYGTSRLASDIGVTRQSIYHWLAGRSHPLPDHALRIVALSGGQVPLDAIYRQVKEPACGSTSTSTSLPSSSV